MEVEPAEVGVQTEEAEAEDNSSDSGSRRERYLHCGLSEASDPDLWMQVRHHNLRGEDDRFVHSDDLGLITSACTKYDMEAEQFCELLEGYGGDHLKRQIMTALGTVMYYHEQGRDEDANRLMCDVQYKVGGSTFVHIYLRHYLPNRRFEVSARGEDGPQVGDIMNISRALEEFFGTRFVPPPWRPYLDFGGSDLEEERFHGPMEVEDSEEAVRRQAAMEDDLAEAYRVDAIRNRTIQRLRDGAEEARVRAEFDAAEAMDAEADLLGVM